MLIFPAGSGSIFPLAVLWAFGFTWFTDRLPKTAQWISNGLPVLFLLLLGSFYIYLFSL